MVECERCINMEEMRKPPSLLGAMIYIALLAAAVAVGIPVFRLMAEEIPVLALRGFQEAPSWGFVVSSIFFIPFIVWLPGHVARPLWDALVGRTVFVGLDPELHIHPGMTFSEHYDFQVNTLFELRIGGLFRENRIYGPGTSIWRIVRGWRGTDICLRDINGYTLEGVPLSEAIKLVATNASMEGLFAKKRTAEAILDALGAGVSYLILVMRHNKESERSPREAEFRRRLEGLLADAFPDALSSAERLRMSNRWHRKAMESFRTQTPSADMLKMETDPAPPAVPLSAHGRNGKGVMN